VRYTACDIARVLPHFPPLIQAGCTLLPLRANIHACVSYARCDRWHSLLAAEKQRRGEGEPLARRPSRAERERLFHGRWGCLCIRPKQQRQARRMGLKAGRGVRAGDARDAMTVSANIVSCLRASPAWRSPRRRRVCKYIFQSLLCTCGNHFLGNLDAAIKRIHRSLWLKISLAKPFSASFCKGART